jgi:signal transduction histidine kinase
LKQSLIERAVLIVPLRILLLISVFGLVSIGYLYLVNKNHLRQIEVLMQDRDNQSASHFNEILKLFQKPLDIVSFEYSLWDEMVYFVQKRDKKWAQENVDFLLRQYGLGAVWVFDPGRSLVYSAHTKSVSPGVLYFSEEMKHLLFSSLPSAHFFLPTDRGLLEVIGAKIQPSSDNARITPARGFLFAARPWSTEVVAELANLTQSVVTLDKQSLPKGTLQIMRRENGVFVLRRALMGWDGKPVACLSVQDKMSSVPGMDDLSDRSVILSVVFILSTLGLLSVSLWAWIGKPLSAISSSLKEEDSGPILSLTGSLTEFGQISRIIDRFFKDKKHLVEEVERRKEAEEQLRLAGEVLEQRVAERTEELSKSRLQLRSLASELLLAEERERRRIADDLHDHIGQILVLAKLRVQQLKESLDGGKAHAYLEEVQNLLAETLNYSRSLTAQLSPPVLREFGFEAAVKSLASEFERKYSIPITIEDRMRAQVSDDQIGVLLYRSVRELLTNVVKHSEATAIRILFATDGDRMVTEVEDNGFGFSADQIDDINEYNRFGLFSIRERLAHLGGEMVIESLPGKGTIVRLFVPAILAMNGIRRV